MGGEFYFCQSYTYAAASLRANCKYDLLYLGQVADERPKMWNIVKYFTFCYM